MGVIEATGSNGDNEREIPGHTHYPTESSLSSAAHGAILSPGKGCSRQAVGMTKNNFSQHRFEVGGETGSLQ